MIGRYLALAATCLIATANATVYFQEKFDEVSRKKRHREGIIT